METSYWLTRFFFQRALGGIYCIAFLIALNQGKALLGTRGLLPIPAFLRQNRFYASPSLFHYRYSDRILKLLSLLGLGLSFLALLGFSDAYGTLVSVMVWGTLWILYLSLVNVGQTFYAFGWEILLLETGFLAVFLGPSRATPSVIVIFLLRWLLFRLMLGAGLIKLRGDPGWRDLSCLKYHYETMPLPNLLSRFFYYLPTPLHKASVLFNHFVELLVPFFYFGPRLCTLIAGGITIFFQAFLVVSGNFSWLNHLSMVLALSCIDDSFYQQFLPWLENWARLMNVASFHPETAPLSGIPAPILYLLAAGIAYLSIGPIKNLISSKQVMNTSFDPLRLVNTYGAFGSITRKRNEIIFEAAEHPDGPWSEYEFKAKPGPLTRMPPVISPYHFKLDWQMWFAAMSAYTHHPWVLNFVSKLLHADPDALSLLKTAPFQDKKPKFVRARLYHYQYDKPPSAQIWKREFLGEYLPALSLDDPNFIQVLKSQGWWQA